MIFAQQFSYVPAHSEQNPNLFPRKFYPMRVCSTSERFCLTKNTNYWNFFKSCQESGFCI